MRDAVKRVLLVDDESAFRTMVVTALADYAVQQATDGARALACLRAAELPDVIVTDLDMPGMGGAEFVTACRADPRLASIPIVLVSAAQVLPETAARLNVPWLRKPFRLVDLLALVEALTAPST